MDSLQNKVVRNNPLPKYCLESKITKKFFFGIFVYFFNGNFEGFFCILPRPAGTLSWHCSHFLQSLAEATAGGRHGGGGEGGNRLARGLGVPTDVQIKTNSIESCFKPNHSNMILHPVPSLPRK